MNPTKLFSAVTRWSLYSAFFLIPLFFLPWTTGVLEINKQMLLVILALLSLVSWLGSMVLSKRLSFRSGLVNVLPALFLGATLVSSALSLAGYQTWVGQASQEYASFLTAAMYVILFYVLLNNAGERSVERGIITGFLASASLSGLIAVLGIFNIVHLPFAFAQSTGFNTVGNLNALTLLLTAAMFMGLAGWLVAGGKGKEKDSLILRVLTVVVTACTLILLAVVDFWLLWAVCVLGVLMLAAFGFLQSGTFPDPRKFALPLFILLVSVLLMFVRTPIRASIPVSVSPSYGTSWGIAKSVLSEGPKRLLMGSGPGTYEFDYARFRPNDVNNSIFWDTHFDRSKSHVLTLLTTTGVVGSVLWLCVMLSVAALALARLMTDKGGEAWNNTFVLFIGWSTLFVGHILYSSNLVLSFVLWGFAGLLAAQAARGTKETDFGHSPRLGLACSFAFVVMAFGVLATLFVTGSRYGAEVAFAKAVELDRAGKPMDEVVAELSKAVSRNSLSDVYYRNLASAMLAKARMEIASAGGKELTAEQRTAITNDVNAAMNAAKRATDIEPNNASNWVARGSVYRDVMSYVQNAEDFAATTFSQALALEPGNPSHQVNLGRLHVAVADRAHQLKDAKDANLAATAKQSETSELAAAEQAFTAAIQLKPDYAPAHYYLAATYERQGRIQEAVTRLEAIRAAKPNDLGLGFQLSMLYMRTQKYDAARAELERIVALSPNYSNALWYLASMYEINGDADKATAAVQQVANLNPDNAAVKTRLAALRAGEKTTKIPAPVEEDAETATDVEGGDVEADAEADGEGVVDAEAGNE